MQSVESEAFENTQNMNGRNSGNNITFTHIQNIRYLWHPFLWKTNEKIWNIPDVNLVFFSFSNSSCTI